MSSYDLCRGCRRPWPICDDLCEDCAGLLRDDLAEEARDE